ncbi:MAG: BMP family ABC transporter substrate-binding protein [Lachnospiraceae bacterium]|nr:BMP family ABC transporter substrate-binding protein [Lachnospiraceae bacterium]
MKLFKKAAVLTMTAAVTIGAACAASAAEPVAAEDMKVGIVYIGDEQEGYTYAHMIGMDDMKAACGLSDDQVIAKYNIPEDESCYDAAVDLAEQGCQIIFANSFGHEDYIMQAASEYPDVQFCHATGYQAATSGLENMHNYFTSVYESRYVSGIVAGMKLAEEYGADTDSKIGYVGAYSYAEVISGYTAFYLGVKSICPNVTMEVKYTGSWADQALEKETAEALIADGCVLVSQHADTTGAASAAEANKVYDVGYNVSMLDAAPNYALTSASIKWGPYYTYAVNCVMNGETIDTDWCQGYADGAVWITDLGTCVAEGTQEAVDKAWAAIVDGSVRVFDTSTWTVGGETITTTATDDLAETYHNQEYISPDGYFMESELASAPAFAFHIDGITELNQVF